MAAREELRTWLGNVLGPLTVGEVAGFTVALAPAVPAAVSVGFSEVDTGLRLDADGETDVRCELVCVAQQTELEKGALAVAGAWNTLLTQQVPAQPGVLLPELVDDPAFTVHHGLLREPQIFERGTPTYTEAGRITLLLELVLLTDEEFTIASEQGLGVLERRLRRRHGDLGDWCRD